MAFSPTPKAPPPLPAGLPVLMDMLTFRRPAFSTSEELFIDRFLWPLPGIEADPFGNLWLTIVEPDGSPPRILWSSHTDTVHHDPGRQSVVRHGAMVRLRDNKPRSLGRSNCLGADCAAGVWIMREMVLAGVPGLYIFHRDEESGGNGSAWIAENASDLLGGIEFAVAFDRMGYSDVITHQGCETASRAFARSLCDVLGGTFRPDDTGLFTDTKNYCGIIAECSNISVGYFNQHGPREELDVRFLSRLRDTVVAADWTGLIRHRQPEDPTDPWADYMATSATYSADSRETGYSYGGLAAYVQENPGIVADFLDHLGFSRQDLEAYSGGWLN